MADVAEISTDAFLGGRVRLIQPATGHRAGLDAGLLQAAVPADAEGRAADLGCGTGAVAFAVAARAGALTVTGIERDAALSALARRGLDLAENASFAGRVAILDHEIGAEDLPDLARSDFDWVLANPPFDEPDRVSASPHAGKRSAYLAAAQTLPDWIAFAARLLRTGGHLAIVHRAEALRDLLAGLQPAFGDVQILPVHPRTDAPAKRLVLRATKGRRTRPRLLPPLVLHPPGGADPAAPGASQWTPQAEALLTGAANMTWL